MEPPIVSKYSQDWDTEEFCLQYEETWEISENEVHYGWLSPGESTLGLLNGLDKKNINVLDIGCGLGQNLIALAKEGATCFGVDISPCMLTKAESRVLNADLNNKITLQQGDMRFLDCFNGVKFDLTLSVYSMEYLSNLNEFRKVISNVYKRLSDGGSFIMCFSHHSQAQESRYPELMNCSVPVGAGKYRPYNYSYKDAMEAIIKTGFTIDNIKEQETCNPSQVSYEESKIYPYHYRKGMNPCQKEFDSISNSNPHTVIFKVSKPNNPLHGIPKQACLDLGYRYVWGYKRTISNIKSLEFIGHNFKGIFLAPMDNVIGLLDVLSIKVAQTDIHDQNSDIELYISNTDDVVKVPCNSVLGLIHRKLLVKSLEPIYKQYTVENAEGTGSERRILIDSIAHLNEKVSLLFDTAKVGLLSFVNGSEPLKGEMPLDDENIMVGDEIKLTYICLMSNTKKDKNQVELQF